MMSTSKFCFSFLFCLTLSLIIGCSNGDKTTVDNLAAEQENAEAHCEQCQDNIKQIVLAFHHFHDAHNRLPALSDDPFFSWMAQSDVTGKPWHSWRVLLSPFLGQVSLYEEIRFDEPWDSEFNKQFHDQMPAIFQCPANPGRGCCYSVVVGGIFAPSGETDRERGTYSLRDITDGTRNTLAIVEVKTPFNWMDPTADVALDELVKGINSGGRVGSFHPGGINVGMFDGVVRFFPNDVDADTLRALATPAGGESVSLP